MEGASCSELAASRRLAMPSSQVTPNDFASGADAENCRTSDAARASRDAYAFMGCDLTFKVIGLARLYAQGPVDRRVGRPAFSQGS